jgi:oligopeptide transport system ATP-binding protein
VSPAAGEGSERAPTRWRARACSVAASAACRPCGDVSFELRAGETLGVVGETGCGKSSLGRAMLQLVRPSEGRVVWKGRNLCELSDRELVPVRKDLQVVFQDPLSSLNPRMTVGEIIAEPLRIHAPALNARRTGNARRLRNDGTGRPARRAGPALSERVQRRPVPARKHCPGDDRRAAVIVCDEPVSALDVSIQAQICNLLRDLQRDTGIAMIFISHDLSIVRYMASG